MYLLEIHIYINLGYNPNQSFLGESIIDNGIYIMGLIMGLTLWD